MLASDLVRQPRRGLRDRIKRQISFLRRVASMSREQQHTRQQQQEVAHEDRHVLGKHGMASTRGMFQGVILVRENGDGRA
jgi:hypothetical protein